VASDVDLDALIAFRNTAPSPIHSRRGHVSIIGTAERPSHLTSTPQTMRFFRKKKSLSRSCARRPRTFGALAFWRSSPLKKLPRVARTRVNEQAAIFDEGASTTNF